MKKWQKSYAKTYAEAKKVKAPPAKKGPKLKLVKPKVSGKGGDKLEKVRLSSGATVLFRPSYATPVISAKAAVLGGLRIEDPNKLGMTELLSRVWTSGTKSLTEAEIQTRVENMAAGLSAFGGRNSAGLSLQMLAPFEDQAMELFNEVLSAPVINAQAVEREKHMMAETIRARQDSPGQVVSQMFIETIFRGHPYERDVYGTNESIAKLSTEGVEQHRRKMVTANNLTVVVTGAANRDRWLKGLEKASSALPKGDKLLNEFKYTGPKENIFEFKKMDREQSHIIVGWKGLTLSDERRYILQIIQSILAGQGGRLFIELRDKASLAYTVSPMRMEGIDAGYFGAYIGCSPEKGAKAISMMHEEFRKLIETPISEAELDRAKRYLVGRHDIDLQRASAIASGIVFNEIYGIDPEETFRYADHLTSITPKDVQKLARELFSTPAVTCAVGRERPW